MERKIKVFGLVAVLMLAALVIGCKQNINNEPETFTVTFGVEGTDGTLKAMVGSSEIHSGDKVEKSKAVTFTATPDAGYTVKEWKADGAVISNTLNTYTHTVTKAVTVKVNFLAGGASYTVKHYQEKAEGGYPEEPTETKKLSGIVGENAAYTPKTGGAYEGFTCNSVLTKVNGTVQPTGTIAADNSTIVELFYERNTVEVTFNLAGGNVSGDTKSIVKTGKYGTAFTAPDEPVKTDAVFKGWNPALLSTLLYPATDAEYTAQWAPLYAIIFDVEGTPANGTLKAEVDGSEIHTGDKVEQGKTVTFTATANEGYAADKWTLSSDSSFEPGTGTDYNNTAKITVTADTDIKVSFTQGKVYMVKGIRFLMKRIEAVTDGSIGHNNESNNKPHKVSLSAYQIGETEVT